MTRPSPTSYPDSGADTPTAENVGAVFYNTEVLFCEAVVVLENNRSARYSYARGLPRTLT